MVRVVEEPVAGDGRRVAPVERLGHDGGREVVDEGDFGLREVAHVGGGDLERVAPPAVDLGGGGGPEDVVEEDVGGCVECGGFDGRTEEGVGELSRPEERVTSQRSHSR